MTATAGRCGTRIALMGSSNIWLASKKSFSKTPPDRHFTGTTQNSMFIGHFLGQPYQRMLR